jgi:plastocyanin
MDNPTAVKDNNKHEISSNMRPTKSFTPKKALILGLALIAVLFVVVLVSNQSTKSNKTTANNKVSSQPPVVAVDLSSTGFLPATISIKKGTVVEWTAADDKSVHMVASNPYPSDDSLAALKSKQFGNGAKYSYQFNQAGTFNYHDDLHPELNGTVIVE